MHVRSALLACLCAILCAAQLSAQTPPALSPLPPQGFQFSGSWNCEGAFHGGQVHKSTYTGSVVLSGKWLRLEEQDLQPATHYVAEYLIGYDPQQKRLVEFDANNFGAATYSSDQGWRDGVLIMTSPLLQDPKAPYVANRFMYSIHGSDNFTVDWQISKTAALDWIPSDHLACARAGNG